MTKYEVECSLATVENASDVRMCPRKTLCRPKDAINSSNSAIE
jgi:hypothetical protein